MRENWLISKIVELIIECSWSTSCSQPDMWILGRNKKRGWVCVIRGSFGGGNPSNSLPIRDGSRGIETTGLRKSLIMQQI